MLGNSNTETIEEETVVVVHTTYKTEEYGEESMSKKLCIHIQQKQLLLFRWSSYRCLVCSVCNLYYVESHCLMLFSGNPLQPEILSMASDMNGGTAKLLMYLLDNLTGRQVLL